MHDAKSTILPFLQKYGNALGAGDLEAIVACWAVPALVVSDQGSQAVTEVQQIRDFFGAAAEQYSARGLSSATPAVEGMAFHTPSIVSVDVRWANSSDDGSEREAERWNYVLAADGVAGGWRIKVAVLKEIRR